MEINKEQINENTYVYCVDCKHFDLDFILTNKPIPEKCKNCYYWCPEDSRPYKERPNYEKDLNI